LTLGERVVYIDAQERRCTNASILYEMSYQEGNERRQGNNHEKWQAGNPRYLSCMRDKDVQDREKLRLIIFVPR